MANYRDYIWDFVEFMCPGLDKTSKLFLERADN
jgi:hypothetical protein